MDPVGFGAGTAWGEIRGNSSSCNHNAPCSGAKSGVFFCKKQPILTKICSIFCSTKILLNKWQISKTNIYAETCCNEEKGKSYFQLHFHLITWNIHKIKGCFTWMIPNLYMKNGWKSPNNCQTTCFFLSACLGFQFHVSLWVVFFSQGLHGCRFHGSFVPWVERNLSNFDWAGCRIPRKISRRPCTSWGSVFGPQKHT